MGFIPDKYPDFEFILGHINDDKLNYFYVRKLFLIVICYSYYEHTNYIQVLADLSVSK
jgi:hypothetical protein